MITVLASAGILADKPLFAGSRTTRKEKAKQAQVAITAAQARNQVYKANSPVLHQLRTAIAQEAGIQPELLRYRRDILLEGNEFNLEKERLQFWQKTNRLATELGIRKPAPNMNIHQVRDLGVLMAMLKEVRAGYLEHVPANVGRDIAARWNQYRHYAGEQQAFEIYSGGPSKLDAMINVIYAFYDTHGPTYKYINQAHCKKYRDIYAPQPVVKTD